MEMTVEHDGDVSVVVLKVPTLDAVNHCEFMAAIAPLLGGNSKVVLDISELKFVDSSGLGAILSAVRRINAAGGEMKLLCQAHKPVRMFFDLVRIYEVIDICNTRQEAVEALTGAAL